MADLLNFVGVRVLDSNAAPGAGYVARFYRSGTTTPVTVYTTSGLGTPHGTFVTADAEGKFPAVWSDGAVDVKCVIETDTGAIVQTIDPVFATSAGAGASDVTFTPTVDLPFTNVQDAIEGAAASAASGFATYGIGITGNATLAVDIDATNIGAGVYRFDNTTTGTFPTGVAAADTGLIETWRQAAGTAMMMLYHATSDRVFHRRMASSAWGAWQRVLVGPENFSLDHIVTSVDTIASNDNDTTIPTSAAAKDYADSVGRILLASKTASASATLDFTEFNNAVYSRYLFEIEEILPATDNVSFRCRFSSNGGSSYDAGATDYVFIAEDYVPAGSGVGDGSAGLSYIEITRANSTSNSAALDGICCEAHVVSAGNASVRTKIYGNGGFMLSGATPAPMRFYGQRAANQDTDAIRFLFSSGNIASGRIRMYGIV